MTSFHLPTIRRLLGHGDWANAALLSAAESLTDAQLDTDHQLGPGSLRKILQHIAIAERVWVARSRGEAETPWPKEAPQTIGEIRRYDGQTRIERAEFLGGIGDDAFLDRIQPYRDSRGTLYKAALGDMLLQLVHHSIHHRAQAVNALKRLGQPLVEVDFMYQARLA